MTILSAVLLVGAVPMVGQAAYLAWTARTNPQREMAFKWAVMTCLVAVVSTLMALVSRQIG